MPLAYLLPEDVQTPLLVPKASSGCAATDPGQTDAAFTTRRVLAEPRRADAAVPPRSRAEAVRGGGAHPDVCPVAAEHAAGSLDPSYSLRTTVATMLEYVLDHQSDAGWLGGPDNDRSGGDQYWPAWDVLYALMQHAEAEPEHPRIPATRIQTALLRYVAEAARRLETDPLDGWSSVRWPEWVAILQRMHDTFDLAPDAPERALLLSTAHTIASTGYNWKGYFSDPSATPNLNDSVPFAPGWTLFDHGVNHAMALKEGGVEWRAGGGAAAAELSRLKVQMLDAAHGMPTGAFSADECLGGREPNRGVELCTIVETAHSLGLLHRTHGDIEFADRAERIIYNSLPGAVSEDMWAHNYLSQPNEIFAGHTDPHAWRTDGPDSTVYGLAPTYGCCTANYIQGWPKWAAGLVGFRLNPMGTQCAIVVSFYAPAEAAFPVAVCGGAKLVMDTAYPFEDVVRLRVDAPVAVDVDMRIPAWAGSATVAVNDAPPVAATCASFHTVRLAPGANLVTLVFAPETVISPGFGAGGGVAVTRGPLLFALPLREQWAALRSYAFNAKDWQVTTNSSWNMALLLSPKAATDVGGASLAHSLSFHRLSDVMRASDDDSVAPFASSRPRVWLTGHARRCGVWGSADGGHTADPPPSSPVCGPNGTDECGPLEEVVLVPFGNTRLRVSVMPYTFA